MVRVGDWELRIVRSGTSDPFPEVQQLSGAGAATAYASAYAVAAPGQAFEVQVIQHPSHYAYQDTYLVSDGCRGPGAML